MARIETAARWTKALKRATERGVQVRQLATSGVWIATSGTDARTAYVVTVAGCECRAAAEGDPVCCHRAALRAALGESIPEPTPPTPAAPVALPRRRPVCPDCDGAGCIRRTSATFGTTYRVTCRGCGGSGEPRRRAA